VLLDNNIVNELVENGLVSVKTVKSNNPTPDVQALVDLQAKAKAAKAGKWDPNAKVLCQFIFLICCTSKSNNVLINCVLVGHWLATSDHLTILLTVLYL